MKRANMLSNGEDSATNLRKDVRFWMVMISLVLLGLLLSQGVGK